jgi:hypothetical protein
MNPALVEALTTWNDTRLASNKLTVEIDALKARRRELDDRLEKTVTLVETILPGDFDEEPIGLRIGDDYIVVVSYDTCVCVQVVDFNLREEILDVQ